MERRQLCPVCGASVVVLEREEHRWGRCVNLAIYEIHSTGGQVMCVMSLVPVVPVQRHPAGRTHG